MKHSRVLLIAYHFPPIQGSTGVTRTVAFSRYLAEYGWEVRVLTARRSAYEHTSSENESLIPSWVAVDRAWGLDARRSLSVRGKYLRLLALPDRWQSWIVGGFVRGCRTIKGWRPDVIMSTYPVASAHLIGYLLQRTFRLPWVAEFRDPMLQPNYPSETWERKAFGKTERLVFSNAAEVVVTTDGCRRMYLDRYPRWNEQKVSIISNGYDPIAFAGISPARNVTTSEKLVLLHSGLLYPHERDPSAFFAAVESLSKSGFFDTLNVEFRFRASGNEDAYLQTVRTMGIDTWVKICPGISYQKALEEMMAADGLMIFQADNCNDQIPAKTYEYMYCGKPILAFVHPDGDTGKLLRSVGVQNIAKLESEVSIERELKVFLHDLQSGTPFVVSRDDANRFSRRTLTGDLSRVLQRAIDSSAFPRT